MAEYIEREAVLKHLDEGKGEPSELCYTYALYRSVEHIVRDIPAADVAEVKHGEWENYPSHAHRRCSVCKIEYEKPRFNVRANYCPNCGAKMKGLKQ